MRSNTLSRLHETNQPVTYLVDKDEMCCSTSCVLRIDTMNDETPNRTEHDSLRRMAATRGGRDNNALLPVNHYDDEKDDGKSFHQKRVASTRGEKQEDGDKEPLASRKKRKLNGDGTQISGNEHDADGDSVIDLTSPPPNYHQRTHIHTILPSKTPEVQAVISLLDSSSDDESDYDTKPSAASATREQPLEHQAYTSSSEEEDGSGSIYDEHSHTIIEIVDDDDETAALPFASFPLPGITNDAFATAAMVPPASNTTATVVRNLGNEQLFQDFVEGDLSHQNKEEIYADARRQEQRLQKELDHLYDQLRSIGNDRRTYDSSAVYEARTVCHKEIHQVKEQLKTAQQNAAQDIFNRNNSAGGMGNMDANNGHLSIDFHGLYVKEAIAKFDEMVMPILPVQREVMIITGKGIHSRNGKSKLRDGIVAHISRTDEYKRKEIQCEVNPSNRGQLIVRSLLC